jgi:glucose-1-phosphate adenylyltransferase
MKRVLGIILAGGNGSRMGALTQRRAKPLLPFAAGCTVIDFALSNCMYSGINEIFVMVDYDKEKTARHVSRWKAANGVTDDVQALEPRFNHYLGTADAVRQNLDLIKRFNPDVVMILAADHIYRMDYREMLDFHIAHGADITLAVKEVDWESAGRFGIVTVNDNHEIERFAEKPRFPESNLASMGIYAINADNLIEMLEKGFDPSYTPLDFGNDIIPAMLGQRRALAFKYGGYWRDIGTVEAYYDAHMDLLGAQPDINLAGHSQILSEDKQNMPFKIAYSDKVVNSIICPSCRIDGRVENSILSPGVHVKSNAVVRNSIVFNNAVLGEYSLVDHCIIDEDARVDRLCYVGKPSLSEKRSNITVIGQGCRLSSYDALLLTYRSILDPDETFTLDFVSAGRIPPTAMKKTAVRIK